MIHSEIYYGDVFVIDESNIDAEAEGSRQCEAELVKSQWPDSNSNSDPLVDVHELKNVQITSDLFSYQRQAESIGDKNVQEDTLSIQTDNGRDICTNTRGWWDPKHLVLYHIGRPALLIRYEVKYSDIASTGKPGEMMLKSVNISTMDNDTENPSMSLVELAQLDVKIKAQAQLTTENEHGSISDTLHSPRRRQSSRLADGTVDFDNNVTNSTGVEHRELRWLTRNMQHQGDNRFPFPVCTVKS